MLDDESQLNLAEDLPSAEAHLAAHSGQLVEDEGDAGVVWLTLTPADHDETFYARVAWSSYPGEAPSIKFASSVGGDVDRSSHWPMVPGYRPGNLDICQPICAEGFATHPEWKTSAEAWRATGNPMLWIVETLQRDLDTRYQGRSA